MMKPAPVKMIAIERTVKKRRGNECFVTAAGGVAMASLDKWLV